MKTNKRGNPAMVKGAPSVNPNGRGTKSDHFDDYMNTLTAMGVAGRDKTVGTSFEVDVVDAESALQLWRGDPIAARIVEMQPHEALRQGYDLQIGEEEAPNRFKPEKPMPAAPPAPGANKKPPARMDWIRHPSAFHRAHKHDARKRSRRDAADSKDLQETITKQVEDLHTNALIKEAMCYARSGGGGALLLGANDFTTDLREPLDLKKVRSLDYLTPLETREIVPRYWYNNPRAPKFGTPAIYQLVPYMIGNGVQGDKDPSSVYTPETTLVHESRLVIFQGTKITRRQINGATFGWGDSVFTRVGRALIAWNAATKGASQLLADFAQAVYKVEGLAALIAKDPNALRTKMIMTDLMRSIARAIILDAEHEDFERKATPMSGFPETLDRLMANLSSAADVPLTLLFGQSPGGLNATGDSDIRFFYDRVASTQQIHVAPAVTQIVRVLLAAAGEDPDTVNFSIKFKPLWQPTDLELAQARYAQAQTDQIYITTQVVTPEEIAVSRFGGDAYSAETTIDFDARDSQEAIAAPGVDANPEPDPILVAPGNPAAPQPGATPTTKGK